MARGLFYVAKRKRCIKEYWTVFYYGSSLTLCSRHRTPEAADRAATKCERRGGSLHKLLYVEELDRAQREE